MAPRCVSAFVSAAASLKLPVYVDSPHLGAVPAHQSSGDGYTGFLPLDIIQEIFAIANNRQGEPSGLVFDARASYTIWEGSCRIQDWTEVSPAASDLAPQAAAVYRIAITKNGERNTLFAVGSDGVAGEVQWRSDFHDALRTYGTTPALSNANYSFTSCKLVAGTKLSAKQFASRVSKFILFCAQRLGYTKAQLKELHITPHSLHGSMAAYAEAMEWSQVPIHKLGRWRLPSADAAVVPVRKHRGAGKAGPKTITAVYSTAASCQTQLSLRCRVVSAIRAIGSQSSTHGDLSCFISNPAIIELGFRGPLGHNEPPSPALALGVLI